MLMPRFYFHVVDDRSYTDIDGLELADVEAARREAEGFAGDLMRMEPERAEWSSCAIHVVDEAGALLLAVPFSSEAGGATLL